MTIASDRKQRIATVRGQGRQTAPAGFAASGLGTVSTSPQTVDSGRMQPNRVINRRMQRDLGGAGLTYPPSRSQLALFARTSPLRLLTYLRDISPQVDFAANQSLALAIPEEGLRIVALDDKKEIHEADTQHIEDLWATLPDEAGGLAGLQDTQMLVSMFCGVNAVEGVAGKQLQGLARVWPVDPLTLLFSRESQEADISVWQRQLGGVTNYVPLRSTTFFWNGWQKWVDDPWSHTPYATVLPEILVDMAMVQDIRDSVHANAWPRKAIPFNWENTYKIARDIMHITNIEKAKQFVNDQFELVKTKCKQIQPDEDWVYDASNGVLSPIVPGNYSGLEHVIKFFQQRIAWGVKKLPSMMGLADNTSESFSTLSWLTEARQLEKMRSFILLPLTKIAQLHLELGGRTTTASPMYERLRTSDALIDAQVRAIEIRNELLLWSNGFQSQEQVSIKLTGSKPVKAMDTPASMGNPNGNPGDSAGNAGQNPDGGTANDQKASQGANRTANKTR